jgi:hypothetical protein
MFWLHFSLFLFESNSKLHTINGGDIDELNGDVTKALYTHPTTKYIHYKKWENQVLLRKNAFWKVSMKSAVSGLPPERSAPTGQCAGGHRDAMQQRTNRSTHGLAAAGQASDHAQLSKMVPIVDRLPVSLGLRTCGAGRYACQTAM